MCNSQKGPMSTVRPDAEGCNFSVQMLGQIWDILGSLPSWAKQPGCELLDPGNFSRLGCWISSLRLQMGSNKGLGWAFGMEGFWDIQVDVNTLSKLWPTLSHIFLSDCRRQGDCQYNHIICLPESFPVLPP